MNKHQYEQTKIPQPLKIACDINLETNEKIGVVEIVRLEKMTLDNYNRMCPFETTSYEDAVSGYKCDTCKNLASAENPIYARESDLGYELNADICEKCLARVFESGQLNKLPGWNPGPVYSLKSISELLNELDFLQLDQDHSVNSEREKIQEEFREQLKANGHLCVRGKETFPSQTVWCGQEQCTEKNK